MLRRTGFLAGLTLAAGVAHAGLILPPMIVSSGHQSDPLVKEGLLDATLYGADPSGMADSTAAIQAAINDGRDYVMTTYLPPGTYVISDTLVGVQNGAGQCFYTQPNYGAALDPIFGAPQAPTLVGPPTGPRPLIRLKDGSTGFASASSPKAALHFWNDNPTLGNVNDIVGAFGCMMYGVIRDVDLDLGANPGAVGVQFYSAQWSYMEDVSVDASQAYAGIQGAPATSAWVNLSVNGGQYGILLDYAGTNALVGISLSNQTVAGLSMSGDGATSVVGFEIDEPSAQAVVMSRFSGTNQMTQLSLVDGNIQQQSAQPAIDNTEGLNLFLQNVFVSTPGPLVQSVGQVVSGSGATDLVSEYAFNDTAVTGAGYAPDTSYSLIDGTVGQNGISSVQPSVGAPPSDLVLRHLPGRLPWPTDPGVVDVTAFGADPTGSTDSTAALQSAIDASFGNGDEVFLPRGTYLISGTLTLHPDTHFFGVPGPKSKLWASTWDPNGANVPFVRTADTATGKTYVGDVSFILPQSDSVSMTLGYDQSYLGALEWQAGRSSVLNEIEVQIVANWSNTADPTGAARDLIHVKNNGGGRWYGIEQAAAGWQTRTLNAAFRFLLVDGTTTPLTLYGPNFEHGLGDDFTEVSNASNFRVFGSKTECDVTWMALNGSTNALITAITGNSTPAAFLVAQNSTNFEGALFGWYDSGGTCWSVENFGGGFPDAGVPCIEATSLFQQGTFDATPFPHCGDGVCDGAETSANCPADCSARADAGATSDAGAPDSGDAGAMPPAWTACQATLPPTLDGGDGAWSAVPGLFLPYTSAVLLPDAPVLPTSNAQLSAWVRTAWDEGNLYVLVQVTDPAVVDDGVMPIQFEDGVELYLDGTFSRASRYDAHDFQLIVTAGDRADPAKVAATGFVHSTALTAAGYEIEYAVPRTALGSNQGVIGFDVAVNDKAGAGQPRQSQLMWSGNGDAWQDPQQFGTLMLSPQACSATDGGGGQPPAGGQPPGGGANRGTVLGCSSSGDAPAMVGLLVAVWLLWRRRVNPQSPRDFRS